MNDKLTLMDRNKSVGERKQIISEVVQFTHEDIINHFDENINSIRKSFEILDESGISEEHKKDILRSQIMFLDSALDFYIHEITKYGMKKMYEGQWERTEKYLNVKINLDDMHIIENDSCKDFFNDIVNKHISGETFMSYSSIKSQFNLLGLDINNIQKDAFFNSSSEMSVKNKFKVYIDSLYSRRNQIAHQSDRSDKNSEKNDIDKNFVEKNIDIVINLVKAIDKEIKRKDK